MVLSGRWQRWIGSQHIARRREEDLAVVPGMRIQPGSAGSIDPPASPSILQEGPPSCHTATGGRGWAPYSVWALESGEAGVHACSSEPLPVVGGIGEIGARTEKPGEAQRRGRPKRHLLTLLSRDARIGRVRTCGARAAGHTSVVLGCPGGRTASPA